MENKTRMVIVTTSIDILLEVLPISMKKEKNVKEKTVKKKQNFKYVQIILNIIRPGKRV